MTISLTLDLRRPDGSPLPNGGLVWVRYTKQVSASGMTVPEPAATPIVIAGPIDSTIKIPYASDDPAVDPASQGFGLVVSAQWRQGTDVVSSSETYGLTVADGAAPALSDLGLLVPSTSGVTLVQGPRGPEGPAGPGPTDAGVAGFIIQSGSQTQAAVDSTIDAHLGGNSTGLVPLVALKSGLPVDGTNAAGVDPTGATECSAAIQSVLNSYGSATLGTNKQQVRLVGTFNTANTLVIKGNVDFTEATIKYTGSGTAIQVGDSSIGQAWNLTVHLGEVICVNKPAGASWISGSVGLCVKNVFQGEFTYKRIQGFETNLLELGDGSYGQGGCAYNIFYGLVLEDGLVNQSLQIVNTNAPVQAFVNENVHIGGSWKHYVGTYPQSGMRHITIHAPGTTAASINGNRWVGCTLEGGFEEYVIDCNGTDNVWRDCRFEFTNNGGQAPIIWQAVAYRNRIDGGYGAAQISPTSVSSAGQNWIVANSASFIEMSSDGGLVMSNLAGGTSGVLTLMRAGWRALGDTVLSNWQARITGSKMRFKVASDTVERVIVDVTNAQISLGIGNPATPMPIMKAGYGEPLGAVTAPPGSVYMTCGGTAFARYEKATSTDATGWHAVGFEPFTTAARPTPAKAGIGGTYFDTTLNKPGWSDGTSWRDATGATM